MSQPPNTTSLRGARGTKSEMRGLRPSVRLPRRTVPIWVRLPMGRERPWRIASTPAMKVVATAPIPGRRTPSLPWAGAMGRAFALVMIEASLRPSATKRQKRESSTPRGGGQRCDRGSGGRDAPGAGEEGESGRGQLAVVARSHEALLSHMVVEDARAGEVLLGVERIEHEDPGVSGKSAVVEEIERQVTHGHLRCSTFWAARFLSREASRKTQSESSGRALPLSRSSFSRPARARGPSPLEAAPVVHSSGPEKTLEILARRVIPRLYARAHSRRDAAPPSSTTVAPQPPESGGASAKRAIPGS